MITSNAHLHHHFLCVLRSGPKVHERIACLMYSFAEWESAAMLSMRRNGDYLGAL
jgi:hypothetical protein